MALEARDSRAADRRIRPRLALGATLAALTALSTSCLFSTATPKTADPGAPGGASPEAVVTGLVQLVDRRDLHVRKAENWTVRAIWIVRDRNGDGVPDTGWIQFTHTGSDGVFRVAYNNRETLRVELYALNCNVDPTDTTAFQWTAVETTAILPGEHVHNDLAVPCDHVP